MTTTHRLSMRNRQWVTPAPDAKNVAAFEKLGFNRYVAQIMAGRGVPLGDIDNFVKPTLRNLMPDPYTLKDMEVGAQRIAKAIVDKQRIGIWSDYDCDGATSAAVLGRFLRMCGHDDFKLRIPDRITEGYGPNTPGMLEMKEQHGCDLVCTLDAGIVAYEPLAAAAEAGIEVIVIDHHMAREELPQGIAIINPNRHDDTSGLGHLCAAGVTFMFAVAVARILKGQGFFNGKDGHPARVPDLMSLLDIVALGTVADVVPLKTLNRAFVRSGTPYLTARGNPGIREMATLSGLAEGSEIAETECGWRLGPRINAGGRLADSHLGALLLLEDDPELARERAEELEKINTERKAIGDKATEAAIEQIGPREPGDRRLAIAVVDAHEGVVGISAGKLKEAYDAPAIVLTEDHEGNLKGSARSVPGFDIGHAIIAAAEAGLIVKGGGHGMAGGLSLTRAQLDPFIDFMNVEIGKSEYAATGVITQVDLEIPLKDLTPMLVDRLMRSELRPFGTANPEPVVQISGLELSEIRIMKDIHMKLVLKDGADTIDALIWGVAQTEIGARIREAKGRLLDVIGKVDINTFRGVDRVQIVLDDLRLTPGKLL